jgi:hypothetical protein
MSKLEKLHLNLTVSECAGLTSEIAVKFAEWLSKYPDKNRNIYGEILHAKSKYDGADTTKNLFKIFIDEFNEQ